jgi:hypothetical protein
MQPEHQDIIKLKSQLSTLQHCKLHSAPCIYISNEASTPSFIGQLLASVIGQQFWLDSESVQVTVALEECIKDARDKREIIQKFKNKAEDLINPAVMARH